MRWTRSIVCGTMRLRICDSGPKSSRRNRTVCRRACSLEAERRVERIASVYSLPRRKGKVPYTELNQSITARWKPAPRLTAKHSYL